MNNKILMAAAQEMNERGVKFTIDAVAARLGISKKTLYQYYPSKDALIAEIVQTALTDVATQEQTILGSAMSFEDKLRAFLTVTPQTFGKVNDWVYDDLRRYRPTEWGKIQQYSQTSLAYFRDILEQGITDGDVRPINTWVAARMLKGICDELMNYEFLSQSNLTFTDALQHSTDIFLRGILSDLRRE